MQPRLKDKAIIVIGSATGIGAATVRRLHAEGARVCAADINIKAAEALATELSGAGGEVFAVQMDIADEASVKAGVAAAAHRLGHLDGAHLNAADLRTIMIDHDVLELDLEVLDRTIAVNLRGHFVTTRAVLPHLLARGAGAIVYTSSSAGDEGEPTRPSYASSKSGLNALMRHVATRWGRQGITSNCVAPGFTLTPEMTAGGKIPSEFTRMMEARTPSTRLGRVEDIAGVVAMLLSDDGRWVNGQVYHVNGGALLR